MLRIKGLWETDPQSDASLFLSGLPVCNQIANLMVGNFEMFQAVHLARAFPSVRKLTVYTREENFEHSSFPCLAVFTSMEILSLSSFYSAAQLATLCLKIPSLRFLNTGVKDSSQQFHDVLATWGRSVVLSGV